ncbi:hypothetical protein [Sphingomonas alba]|uniref:Uncharacterized protein n=1 Tax=Sphingomonas alba TaxID=2908208 RepID=A0ABT0RMZ5_9SPHN|nr:hypothetical protein [Sphingomonas alba]MCL6684021.1 hypothetical protein [Sphingomonas alba]
MIPMKHSSIFKSRWMALIWAAGIIYFAMQVATPGPPAPAKKDEQAQATDITGAPVKDEDMKKLEKAIKGL